MISFVHSNRIALRISLSWAAFSCRQGWFLARKQHTVFQQIDEAIITNVSEFRFAEAGFFCNGQ